MTTEERVTRYLPEDREINLDSSLDDLGLDSLDFLQMVVDLDSEFSIKLDIEKAAMCTTVGELVALVDSECSVSN